MPSHSPGCSSGGRPRAAIRAGHLGRDRCLVPLGGTAFGHTNHEARAEVKAGGGCRRPRCYGASARAACGPFTRPRCCSIPAPTTKAMPSRGLEPDAAGTSCTTSPHRPKLSERTRPLLCSTRRHRFCRGTRFVACWERDLAPVREAKTAVREQLLSMEGRSHAVCEWAKFVSHFRRAAGEA